MAEAPRLFLITPPIAHADGFAPLLRAAVAAADIASVLLRSATRDEPNLKSLVRQLAPIAQAKNIAVLIEDARLAGRLDIDGAHLDGPGETLDETLAALQPRKIVGVGGLTGRDAAMAAGERGADYLMFGWPGGTDSHETICEKVAWWSEIFNVPCVGYAHHPDLASDIALAGAEFVGLGDGLWESPDTVATTLTHVARAIAPVGAS